MRMFRFWTRNLVWMSCLALSSLAHGQSLPAGPEVKCQELNPNDLAAANPKIVNFDASTQAYVVCLAQNTGSNQVVVAGLVPRFGSGNDLGLDDFQNLANAQSSQDLFVHSAFAEHRVASFSDDLLGLSAVPDAIQGPVKTQTVTQHICKTEYQTQKECKVEPKQVCKVVYGRTECYYEDVEVCHDVTVPVQTCSDVPTTEYVRELPGLSGEWKTKPTGYCAQGQVEKRSRVVYGRKIQEQRCCENKVVYGQTQKVCGPWEAI